ncbi:MAG: acyltransferase family protein [Planctomycetaceae bacterium]
MSSVHLAETAPPSPGHNLSLGPERSLGPDAVRAGGALLVVFLHACVPYLVHPMPGLVWPVRDATSRVCDALFWSIELFVMPLFLVISGVYTFRALRATQPKAFLQSRSRRLLRPLAFGAMVVLPLDLYIWMLGFVAEGVMPVAKLRSLKVPAPYGDHLWGLSHLWYLLYVYLYGVVLVITAQWLRDGLPLRWRPLARRASAVALMLTGVVALVFAPNVVFGFQHAFAPVWSKWIYSGTFFAGGVAIAIFDPRWRTVDRLAGRSVLFGLVATCAAVTLGCWSLQAQESSRTAESSWWVAVTLASLTVAAAWLMALGLIGLANRCADTMSRQERLRQTIQYLAGASFWIYLVHHPLVGLVHTDLKWLVPSLSPLVKAVIATAVTVGWSLASYEGLIRTTALGRWLGLASPTPKTLPPALPATSAAEATASPIKVAA